MLVIPTQPQPAQVVHATLGGQVCRVEIAQKSTGMFLALYVNDVLIIGGVLCLVGVQIVRDAYLGFTGDLAFFDTQPGAAPLVEGAPPDQITSAGLGSRYFLAYLP